MLGKHTNKNKKNLNNHKKNLPQSAKSSPQTMEAEKLMFIMFPTRNWALKKTPLPYYFFPLSSP